MIAILDYKAGNAPSVLHAAAFLGYNAVLAHEARDIERATHIVLPGVGSARATMESLRDMGLINALEEAVLRRKVCFLGICVGLQILFEHSEEENTDCLGWIKGRVVKFDSSKARVPQMGWNQVKFAPNASIDAQDDYFYFVNSYYAKPDDKNSIWGTADYNGPFAAAVSCGNIFATQFHVEKSGGAGLELFNKFLSLKGGAEPC